MLLYVHNLEYYMLVEVIEPQWDILLKKLPTCRDLDQILECHRNFQNECLVKCMLNNPNHFEVCDLLIFIECSTLAKEALSLYSSL